MTVGELGSRMTHREFRSWVVRIQNKWDEPTRSDFYLMQIAQRVQQVLSTRAQSITVKDQKLNFEFKGLGKPQKKKKLTPEQKKDITECEKDRWCRGVGMEVTKHGDGSRTRTYRSPSHRRQ